MWECLSVCTDGTAEAEFAAHAATLAPIFFAAVCEKRMSLFTAKPGTLKREPSSVKPANLRIRIKRNLQGTNSLDEADKTTKEEDFTRNQGHRNQPRVLFDIVNDGEDSVGGLVLPTESDLQQTPRCYEAPASV
jgi:hypothetical protein